MRTKLYRRPEKKTCGFWAKNLNNFKIQGRKRSEKEEKETWQRASFQRGFFI